MTTAKLLLKPILIAFCAGLLAFLLGLFLIGMASIYHIFPAEGLLKKAILAMASDGLPTFVGVLLGTAVARERQRWVAAVLTILFVAYEIFGELGMLLFGKIFLKDMPELLPFPIAGLLGAVLALFFARQRYQEVGLKPVP